MDAKTLRASILQMAIEGKLVPQLDEEPAVAQIGDAPEEVPFEIPGKWQFVELGKVVDVRDGTHATPAYVIDGIPFITSKNLKNGCIDFSNAKFISTADHLEFSKRSKVSPGDILFPMIGTVGNPVVVPNNVPDFSIKNMALFKHTSQSHVDFSFLFFLLKALEERVNSQASGGVQKFVSLKFLRSLVVPLPPLSEQRRIVARLNELLPLVDKFGKAQEALAVLQKEFPEKLKASLLQEAIQGKLVPQLAEEPAVEQIGDAPEDAPFAIPEKWKWVEFSSIVTLLNGRAYKKNELLTKAEGNTPIIRVGNFFTNSSWFYSDLKLDENKYCDNGDLLFSWSASFGPKIWQGGKAIYHYHIWKIILSKFVDKEWLYYWLLGKTEELKASGHGLAMIHITKSGMEKELVALPPLEEQRRIVARLNELLPLVTQMATAPGK